MNTVIQPVHARSFLFVPGDRPDRFDKAVATGADSVIIDLEDAVPPDAKRAAMMQAVGWLRAGGRAIVRVNAVTTPWHATEIEALADTEAFVMVPKSEVAEDLASVTSRLGGHRVIALVETAVGVRDADLVCGVRGVVRVAFGNVDLSAELGVDPSSHPALEYARGRLVMASAAAGIAGPIDGVTLALDSPDTLEADLEVTRTRGFTGKLCIHPRQVASVNRWLQPSEAELSWARRIVEVASSAGGVGVLDGMMVDPPVVARAERILARLMT